MAKLITDASYKKRNKKLEATKGINSGGYMDLTPKSAVKAK